MRRLAAVLWRDLCVTFGMDKLHSWLNANGFPMAALWKMGSIYPWARAFGRFMPDFAPSDRCAKLLPEITARSQHCRKCRVWEIRPWSPLGGFRFPEMVRRIALNELRGGISMCMFSSKGSVWRDISARPVSTN